MVIYCLLLHHYLLTRAGSVGLNDNWQAECLARLTSRLVAPHPTGQLQGSPLQNCCRDCCGGGLLGKRRLWVKCWLGKKRQHKHKLFGPDFPRTFLTLTPRWMPRGQKVSLHYRGRRKTHFLVRTSMIFGADVHDPKVCRKTLYKKSLR